jgi:hypothetical protein
MKTIIDIDERNRIELEDFSGMVNVAIWHLMDNLQWVINGGLLLTKDQAATFGLSLIGRSGKDKQILKAKYQRKD